MSDSDSMPITELLRLLGEGAGETAHARAWALLYDEIHRIAQAQMALEKGGQTLQATALVHEVFLRLGGNHAQWTNRSHFFTAISKVMYEIRVDAARKRMRLKRGGGNRGTPLDFEPPVFDDDPAEALAIHDALEKLQRIDPKKVDLVKLRYFAGLTEEECAEAMGISRSAVQKHWQLARAWLHDALFEPSP